jgi:hypothetical protein
MSHHSMMAMWSGLSLNTFMSTKMFLYVGASRILKWTLGDVKLIQVHISFNVCRLILTCYPGAH